MTKEEERKNDIKRLKLLVKAISFNHDKSGKIDAIINPDYEIEQYRQRAARLSLPKRFCMYKTPIKDVPKKEDCSEILEEPSVQVDSTYSHKVRSIFD